MLVTILNVASHVYDLMGAAQNDVHGEHSMRK